MNWVKDWYAQNTNPNEEKGTVHDVIKGADVFLGLSVPGVIDEEDVKQWQRSRSCLRWRIRLRRSCPKTRRRTSR